MHLSPTRIVYDHALSCTNFVHDNDRRFVPTALASASTDYHDSVHITIRRQVRVTRILDEIEEQPHFVEK